MVLGFRIPIVRRIPECLNCKTDSTSKDFVDSGFHKQTKISQIAESGFPYMGRIPVFRPKRCKIHTLWDGTHTYKAYIRKCPPAGHYTFIFTKRFLDCYKIGIEQYKLRNKFFPCEHQDHEFGKLE